MNIFIEGVKRHPLMAMVAPILIVGYTLINHPPIKAKIYSTINDSFDFYLDFKYRNYKTPASTKETPYLFTKIQIINGNESIDIPIKEDEMNLIEKQHKINHSKLLELITHAGKWTPDVLNSQTIILIHYLYGPDEYNLSLKYKPDIDISLPIYTREDIETCLKIEYDLIETKDTYTDEDDDPYYLCHHITKYAGPKGNFYIDTPYKMQPENFINVYGVIPHKLLNSDEDNHLKLTTMMGDEYIFGLSQTIQDINHF